MISYFDGTILKYPSISEMLRSETNWNTCIYLGIANLDNEYKSEFLRVTRLAQQALRDHGKWVLGNGLVTKI